MKRFRANLLLAVSVIVLLALSPGFNGHAEGFNPLMPDNSAGTKAPDFTLKDVSGKEVSLSSFKGKPVLLNFWATWCPYCRKERAHLDAVYKEYKDKGLIVISVSTDNSVNTVREFLKKVPAGFIVLSDSDGRVASLYNIAGLPSSLLINREGVIKNKIVGFREWTDSSSKEMLNSLFEK